MCPVEFPAEVSMPESFECDCGQKWSNPADLHLRPDGVYECSACNQLLFGAEHLKLFRRLFNPR